MGNNTVGDLNINLPFQNGNFMNLGVIHLKYIHMIPGYNITFQSKNFSQGDKFLLLQGPFK